MGTRGPSTGPRKQSTPHGRKSTDVTLPIVSVQFDQGIPSGAPKDGRGMYNISEVTRFGRISKPGVKFGTHDHLKFSPSDNPASNHYSIDDSCLRKNIAYSMGRRVNIQTGSLSPPPNLYALKSSDPAPGVTKFAPDVERQKKAECNGNPGPNHYAVPSVEKYKRGSPKYTIGLKPESKVSETPSPNHYFPNHEKTQASVSLNGRPKGESVQAPVLVNSPSDNPASNHYSIDDSCLRKNIAYSMGRRVNIQTGSLSPPPNLYALKSSDPAPGVTKFAPDVGRQKKAECNGNPGPNHYAVPSVEKYKRGSPKYTIGLKPESKVSETPSPNHYFPNHEKTQASVSLNGRPKGESVQAPVLVNSPSDNPASNHYSIDDSYLRKNIAYSMGRRVNIQTGSLSPPPNLYALKSSDPAPGVTKFAPDVGRQKKAECNGNPGPNHYAVPSVEKYKRGSPKYTIGLKPESKVSETPSPNHYFPNHEKTQASVSLNGRPKGESVQAPVLVNSPSDNPASNHYSIDDSCLRKNIAYSMGRRVNIQTGSLSPPPNLYALKSSDPAPGVTKFAPDVGRQKKAECNGNPGPNHYAVPSVEKYKRGSPKYTIGLKPESKVSETPSPNHYFPNHEKTQASVSLNGRPKGESVVCFTAADIITENHSRTGR
ncbi:hypothetical protein AAG570_013103 [Ranatra chinensis]|uniref:Uncharacterized protein n=1 Tax=Ranatra chinensis TaxID=642074 RepID=A0ABD0YFZ0_9HEMI